MAIRPAHLLLKYRYFEQLVFNFKTVSAFSGKYKHNGYQFEVQRIKIHNDSQCKSGGLVSADQNQVNKKMSIQSRHLPNRHDPFPLCRPPQNQVKNRKCQ